MQIILEKFLRSKGENISLDTFAEIVYQDSEVSG